MRFVAEVVTAACWLSETARQLVLEHGGDYLMTVKANQPALQAVVQAQVPDPGAPLLPR